MITEKIMEFKQRLQADIAAIEAELIRFKVRGMGFTAEAKNKHDETAEQLEEMIDGINTKLGNLEKGDEQLWGSLQEAIENRYRDLQAAFQNATETFKTQPGVENTHGNDDGAIPHGDGLLNPGAGEK